MGSPFSLIGDAADWRICDDVVDVGGMAQREGYFDPATRFVQFRLMRRQATMERCHCDNHDPLRALLAKSFRLTNGSAGS